MAAETCDAIIIGTGQAGKPLAGALAGAGWKTAVVERDAVGGTCVNYGCTPTKTMVASARVAHLVGRAADYGVEVDSFRVELATVRERKRRIVESFRSSGQRKLERTEGVDLLFGEASFESQNTVRVVMNDGSQRRLTAERIFINTGTRPRKPDIDGIEAVPTLDSTSIMELDAAPEHLIVIGGGYVGLEFGQMFRRFGSRVTIVQHGPQLLAREDADVAEEVTKILGEEGVDVLLNAEPRRVRQDGHTVRLAVATDSGDVDLAGSHLLVAAGRVPNSERLNLDAAGVATDSRGFVTVNNKLETNVPGIYALGDVNGGPAFTHVAYDDYRIVRANLLDGGEATTDGRLVPYTVFIDPQLGRVGLTEQQAKQQDRDIRVAKLPMAHVARALEVDETRGFMKAVVDGRTGQILGAAILGIEGGEIMSLLQMAMMGRVPYTAIRDGVFAHPTLAESLNSLFTSLEG